MKQRCTNPRNDAYKNYGGRGITVCDEWQEFLPFYNWCMNNGYQEGLTIDRIDNNKGYSPDNCRFVDRFIQANNNRKNIIIKANGKEMTLPQWSKETGIKQSTIYRRLFIMKWTEEEAVNTPVYKLYKRRK